MNIPQKFLDAADSKSENTKQISDSILRCERGYHGKIYSVAYFIFSNDISELARNFEDYQEELVGRDFFTIAEKVRWNNYIFIVASDASFKFKDFYEAKSAIESNRDYARKRVVNYEQAQSVLEGPNISFVPNVSEESGILERWAKRLETLGLQRLMEKPTPRKSIIDKIRSGTLEKPRNTSSDKSLTGQDRYLAQSHIKSLTIDSFRSVHSGKTYQFGRVTLVTGQNGTGKTSLLEAIEHVYCGHNRRKLDTVPVISATLLDFNRDIDFAIDGNPEISQVKSRALSWYKRDGHYSRSIIDGFTRYNFFDTDAAYRIATDLNSDEMSEDLSKIIIGSEASSLWDYLSAIYQDIENALKNTEGDLRLALQMLDSKTQALKKLLERPSDALSQSNIYKGQLRRLGWREEFNNDFVPSDAEADCINEAIGDLDFLLSSELIFTTPFELTSMWEVVQATRNDLIPQQEYHAKLLKRAENATLGIESLLKMQSNLTEWLKYCMAGFGDAMDTVALAKSEYELALGLLDGILLQKLPNINARFIKQPLVQASTTNTDDFESAKARISELRKEAEHYQQATKIRVDAAVRLREAALTLISTEESDPKCPLCHTEFENDEIKRLIEKIPEYYKGEDSLTHIFDRILQLSEIEHQAFSQIESLNSLAAIAEHLKLSKETSCGDVLEKFTSLNDDLKIKKHDYERARNKLKQLTDSGMEQEAYFFLRGSVSSSTGNGKDAEDRIKIGDAISEINQQLESLQAESTALRREISEVQMKIEGLYGALRLLGYVKAPPKSSEDFDSLMNSCEQATIRLAGITAKFFLDESKKFQDFRHELLGAKKSMDEAIISSKRYLETPGELKEIQDELVNIEKTVQSLSREVNSISPAMIGLRQLLAEDSIEGAVMSALGSISQNINSIFSSIHTPSEYTYTGNSNGALKTVGRDSYHSLEQVSTGQRAAFAISIFLAFNATSTAAPPIILIDDPVAHVDDLNSLSFLDYLRDIVVNSNKQVIFATSDTRMASLFSKKFSFLDSEYVEINLTKVPLSEVTS